MSMDTCAQMYIVWSLEFTLPPSGLTLAATSQKKSDKTP